MPRKRFFFFLPLLWLALNSSEASADPCCNQRLNQVYLGPTFYHVHRVREGGTRQDGTAAGVKAGYDRIGPSKIYIGGEALYAFTDLYGHGGSGNRIKSKFTDLDLEGRIGYTFQQTCCSPYVSFTPFVGGGYAVEQNDFVHPSPIPVHFRLNYSYACAGFLSQISLNRCFDVGFNFTIKFMIEGKNKASHDPEMEDSTTLVKNRTHYKIELPITYHWLTNFYVSFVPIYEFREYGHHAGYPFDFLNTRLNIYGATLRFGCYL